MRQALLPSMLETLRTNSRYRQRMALFEIGRVYLPQPGEELPLEQRRLAIALTGPVLPASWYDGEAPPHFGFAHLKGIVETLVQRLHVPGVHLWRRPIPPCTRPGAPRCSSLVPHWG